MRTAAIILARGGSKGLPGKNRRVVAGRPCLAWTMDAALAAQRCGAVDRVALTTDDRELMAMAREAGVDVIERPTELASDRATVDDAARHATLALEARTGESFEAVVILYANVPVRPEGLIVRAAALLRESGADSVQSYAPVGKHHPWWTAVVDERGGVRPWEGAVLNHGVFRRQDLPAAHGPDGGVLAVTRRALFLEIAGVAAGPHRFFGKERRGLVNEEGSVVDIDSEIDLLVADAILRRRGVAAEWTAASNR